MRGPAEALCLKRKIGPAWQSDNRLFSRRGEKRSRSEEMQIRRDWGEAGNSTVRLKRCDSCCRL